MAASPTTKAIHGASTIRSVPVIRMAAWRPPAFKPGRKRRFTSPEMSAVSDSVFACPGTGTLHEPAVLGVRAGGPGLA